MDCPRLIPLIAAVLALLSCSEPQGKLNSSTNSSNSLLNNRSNNASNSASNNGGSGNLVASDFDQSCGEDADCQVVHAGDPCTCNSCANDAISLAALVDWQAEVAAAMCGDLACPPVDCAEQLVAACNEGACTTRAIPTGVASADDWDRSCTVATDCALVFEGAICDQCRCPNTAINGADLDDYLAQFEVCGDSPACPCAGPTVLCIEGRCEVEM